MIRPLVPEMTFNHAKIGMPLKRISSSLSNSFLMYYWYGHYWMVYVVFMVFNHSFITNLIIFVYAILYTRFSGFAFSESELVVQKRLY